MSDFPDSSIFRFSIGDTARFRITKRLGKVVSRASYPELGPDYVFYKVELPDGSVWMAKGEDIEPLE